MKPHTRQCSHLCPHRFAPWHQHRAFCSPAPASPVCADKPTDIPTRPSPCPRPSSAETYLVSSPAHGKPCRPAVRARAHLTPPRHARPASPPLRPCHAPSPGWGRSAGHWPQQQEAPRGHTHTCPTAAVAAHGRYQHLMPVPSSPRGTPGAQPSREQHEGSKTRCPGRVGTRLTALDAWTSLQCLSPLPQAALCASHRTLRNSLQVTYLSPLRSVVPAPTRVPGPRDSCLPRTALPRSPRDAGHPGGCTLGAPATRHTQQQWPRSTVTEGIKGQTTRCRIDFNRFSD